MAVGDGSNAIALTLCRKQERERSDARCHSVNRETSSLETALAVCSASALPGTMLPSGRFRPMRVGPACVDSNVCITDIAHTDRTASLDADAFAPVPLSVLCGDKRLLFVT